MLHLDALRAKEPELAKAWIFANLLAAFLIDDIIQPSLDFPPPQKCRIRKEELTRCGE
ncbi:hypothetical protein A4157S3_590119 [Escherichia coli]|nr:hypothetical protein A4157S3_590119 [Escherichia coli]